MPPSSPSSCTTAQLADAESRASRLTKAEARSRLRSWSTARSMGKVAIRARASSKWTRSSWQPLIATTRSLTGRAVSLAKTASSPKKQSSVPSLSSLRASVPSRINLWTAASPPSRIWKYVARLPRACNCSCGGTSTYCNSRAASTALSLRTAPSAPKSGVSLSMHAVASASASRIVP
eukprot:scaffold274757_cov27-Tisochrysis_lutea.AAC.1